MVMVNRVAPVLALVVSFAAILFIGQVLDSLVGGEGAEQSASTSAVTRSDSHDVKPGSADAGLRDSEVPDAGGVAPGSVDSDGRAESLRPAPPSVAPDKERVQQSASPVIRVPGPVGSREDG